MLSHIPAWVFVVLSGLIMLGWRQSRTRSLRPGVVLGLAAGMVVYSLWGVLSTWAQPGPLLAWLAGVALALTVLRPLFVPAGLRWDASGERVQLPGSWVPMVQMLGIFGIKFALGMAAGLGHAVLAESLLALVAAAGLGVFSGGFMARALAVVRLDRPAAWA